MCSINLERNDRLETSLYFLRSSSSSMIFLIKGVRNALLSSLRNSAHDNDVFAINVSTGINSSLPFLSSLVCIGSRAHDFVGDEWITFLISSFDTSVNESSTSTLTLLKISWGVCDTDVAAFSKSFRILLILSLRSVINLSARSLKQSWDGKTDFCSRFRRLSHII